MRVKRSEQKVSFCCVDHCRSLEAAPERRLGAGFEAGKEARSGGFLMAALLGAGDVASLGTTSECRARLLAGGCASSPSSTSTQ